jgi:signal transduction histidine kinase
MKSILADINQSVIKLLEPLTPEETYTTVMQEALRLVKADYGSVFLEEGGEVKKVYSTDPQIFAIKTRRRGYIYDAIKMRKSFVVDTTEIGKVHPTISKLGIKSNIYISLSYRNIVIGILCVHSKRVAFFTEQELDILQLFGSLASMAIRKAQAYEQTRSALEIRDQFISLAAHELRTPLTTINGYIQLLFNKLGNKDTTESRWIEQLSAESLRLTNMVKEFLDINHIKTGRIDYYLKECSLIEIISRSIKSTNFVYPDRDINFEKKVEEGQDTVIADFDKFIEVFSNILDNAAKFSPIGAVVNVLLYQENDNFIVDIIDKGIGVPQKDMPHIFADYYKAEDNQKEGMGIGLLLCKHIISYHHGTIELFSMKDKGTMVRVKLPKVEL